MLGAVMLNIVIVGVVMLIVDLLSVGMLSVVMLYVVILNANLNVMAPKTETYMTGILTGINLLILRELWIVRRPCCCPPDVDDFVLRLRLWLRLRLRLRLEEVLVLLSSNFLRP
jgi:hypothetical protein